MVRSLATLASALAILGQASASLPSITVKGTKFYYPNGTQFFIKGVAYQQDSAAGGATTSSTTYIDPLSSEANCERDVPLLAALGTNMIRTYAIDPTADHSKCMALLDAAGIYVISDLGSPSQSIDRSDPKWDISLYNRYTSVVSSLANYTNVIGFFAGNEVTNNASYTAASSFVKAAVRDTKAYIAKNFDRPMYVGYAADDDAGIRAYIAQYFNCGEQSDAVDFWGFNVYRWCGESTFQTSGYQEIVSFFSNYSVPVFFAEYGCNTQKGGAEGRIWQEVDTLYSSDMTGVISGGTVYMYFEETNDYGIVSLDGNNAKTMTNYNSLSSRLAKVSPTGTSSNDYSPSNSPQSCPPVGDGWKAGEVLPPTPDSNLCECMYSSLSCLPASGLDTDNYGDIFNYICAQDDAACVGIHANTSSGVYGSYSMCNTTQQLGYVLDQYYKAQDSAASACDFSKQATVNTAASTVSSCAASLSSASSANSVAVTATQGPSSTGSGGSSASSSSFASPMQMPKAMSLGEMAIGLYVVMALAVGAVAVL